MKYRAPPLTRTGSTASSCAHTKGRARTATDRERRDLERRIRTQRERSRKREIVAEGRRGDLRWAKVVAYDPVRRVGRLKLAEGGRDLQFFLRVLEGRLKRQVVEASKQLWMERRKVAGDPGFREVVQGVKDLLVGRELLVELRQSDQGKVIVRRAMEPGDVVVE